MSERIATLLRELGGLIGDDAARQFWADHYSPSRETLPQRRPCETLEFQHHGVDYVVTLGRFADGRLAEVFVNAGKLDSAVDFIARDGAIAMSLALQYGCPAAVLAGALTRVADDTPGGPMGVLLKRLEEGA